MNFLFLNRFFAIIILLGGIIVFGTLIYSNSLVSRLAKEEENRIQLYAKVLQFIATEQNPETDFLFNHIIKIDSNKIPVINVPAIIVNDKGEPIGDNLNLSSHMEPSQKKQIISQELEYMKKFQFKPIPIEYLPGKFNYIYYRESDNLIRLRYYPYFTFSLLFIFVIVLFVLFYIAKRNEQNRVWAGLAKETAHQLGTPISGLIAWIELLKMNSSIEVVHTANEMQKDVDRLSKISERFSKIGSEPELINQPLLPVLIDITEYMNKRFANQNIKIDLQNHLHVSIEIAFNKVLIEWVIENLIKNAIDALPHGKGNISIHLNEDPQNLFIDIEDTGKGIEPQNLKYIFKPGFSTKKRGWGLGLSLAKRIIENYHHGKLFVLRSEPQKGTTFRIALKK